MHPIFPSFLSHPLPFSPSLTPFLPPSPSPPFLSILLSLPLPSLALPPPSLIFSLFLGVCRILVFSLLLFHRWWWLVLWSPTATTPLPTYSLVTQFSSWWPSSSQCQNQWFKWWCVMGGWLLVGTFARRKGCTYVDYIWLFCSRTWYSFHFFSSV